MFVGMKVDEQKTLDQYWVSKSGLCKKYITKKAPNYSLTLIQQMRKSTR